MIRRRYGAGRGLRVAAINHLANVLAVNGFRDGAAKIRGPEPALLVIRQRRLLHFIEEHHFPVKRRARIDSDTRELGREPLKEIRRHLIDEIELTAPKSEQFGFVVLLDVEADRDRKSTRLNSSHIPL